jgi:hypothetical protein
MKQWVRRMRGGAPRVAFCCQGFSSPRLFGGRILGKSSWDWARYSLWQAPCVLRVR